MSGGFSSTRAQGPAAEVEEMAANFVRTGAGDALPLGGLYFGWRVVAALFLAVAALIGVAMYAFIMFAEPLSQQFGWSASQTGTLVSAMWLAGPLALFAGPLIERFGPWRLLMIGMLLQVIALGVLELVSAFWQLYLLRIAMGVGKVVIMTSVPVIVARWFEQRFATAMAIAWAGGAAGGIVMAPLTESLTSAIGWRSAAIVLSAGLVLSMIVAGLLARGAARPADLGLARDGVPLQTASALEVERRAPPGQAAADAEGDLRWRDVVRSMNWLTASLMCLAVIGAGVVAIALQSQEPALLRQAGLSPSAAAAMLGLTAGAALVGSVAAGWLLDRVHVLWSSLGVGASMLTGILSFAALTATPNLPLSALGAGAVGYALGAGEVVWITLFKRQFGPRAFATTYGIFYFSLQVGFASGGFIGGWSLDQLGLRGFLLVCAFIYAPAAVLSVWRPGGGRVAALA